MANTYRSNYNAGVNSGTSGAEVSDRNPGLEYNTDLRYGKKDEEAYKIRADSPTVTPGSWPERPSYTNEGDVISKNRAEKFIKSAKAAGKFKEASDIKEYTLNGRTPKQPLFMNATSFGPAFGAVQTPSMGASGGKSGSVGYASKPEPNAGRPYNWLNSFS